MARDLTGNQDYALGTNYRMSVIRSGYANQYDAAQVAANGNFMVGRATIDAGDNTALLQLRADVGQNETQRLTFTSFAGGDTFTITVYTWDNLGTPTASVPSDLTTFMTGTQVSGSVTYQTSDISANIDAAIEALGSIGAGNITVTRISSTVYDIEVNGALAGLNLAKMKPTRTSGTGTVAIAKRQDGVPATLEMVSIKNSAGTSLVRLTAAGALTYSGSTLTMDHTGAQIAMVVAGANQTVFAAKKTGDAANRVTLLADGTWQAGDGTAALDTKLYRSAADTLKTDDNLHVALAFRHLGSTLGFYNATAAAQPGAYTQTYATASRTHANLTSADLTGISSSTTGSALAEPSGGYVQAEMQQNFRRIQDQIVLLRADLTNAKQVVNSLVDDHQTLGLAT
jgi:hypothetical protein